MIPRERAPDLGERVSCGVVVDARGAWLAALSEQYERREHGGDRVAVAGEAARRAAMDAVGESLGDARPTRTVLGQCGGPRGRRLDAACRTGERGDGARLAMDRGN